MNKKYKLLIILIVFVSIFLYSESERFLIEAKKYFVQGDYDKAEQWIKLSMEKRTVLPEDHYWLGKTYIALQNYDLAYEHMKIYSEKNLGVDKEEIDTILEIISNQIEMTKAGNNIYTLGKIYGYVNSEYSDFAPIIFDNGNKMYFTSARLAEKGKDNIWMVEKVAGEWVDPVLINNLSTNRNESLGSFSEDESVGYLFANYLSDSKMGDIYMSRKHDKGWEKPGLVSGVNTEKIELQPSVFEDRIMFFASNRDGGFGELDLYVSEKVGGSWSKPENLGPVINTQEYEETPFLEWDGKTLYFASNGHPGLGGFDIFKSEKIGETWQDWSKPENLGLVINSVKDERYFYRSPLSNIAYISSNRFIGLGHEDIYRVNITPPEIIEEEPPAIVEIIEEVIPLETLEVDEVIVIDNIFFEFDKAVLLEKSFPTLDYLVGELLKNPQLTVEISGHTDGIGSNEYNLNLSLERAVSVIDYLIEKGVPADNLISKGYGEEDPIADNSTDEGRSQNRRVEMKIVDIEEEVIEPEVDVEEIEIEIEIEVEE